MKQIGVHLHNGRPLFVKNRVSAFRKSFLAVFFSCLLSFLFSFQAKGYFLSGDTIPPVSLPDSILLQKQDSSQTVRDSLSLKQDSIRLVQAAQQAEKDSARAELRRQFTFVDSSPFKDSLAIYYWRISENLGEFREAYPDTTLSGFPGRRYVDGKNISTAYLGNTGTPAFSRIFSEQESLSHFMFSDAYRAYTREPDRFNFINTRVPYSKLEYETESSGTTKNERLNGEISVNLNKALNFGIDIDYLYARGYYNSQGAKHVDFIFYSSYFSDRYRYHFFYNNRSYVNAENGGITNDLFITNPDVLDEAQNMRSSDIPTKFRDTWNRIRGNRFYYTHRYNLGFEKETGQTDEDGEDVMQFITVGSIIHTADLQTQSRRFISDFQGLDTIYTNKYLDMETSDTTRTYRFKNTVGLSLREGFAKWAKFDLTAYASFDYRQYLLMEKLPTPWLATQTATYLGGELAQTTGKIFRYNAHAEFGILGENLGDVDLSGTIETRIPVFKDTASLKLKGYIKNLTPSFYENHYHSKYFWWDHDFDQTQRVFLGGELTIPHTKSKISVGVENISNYIYFNEESLPEQEGGSIQVVTLRLDQNFRLGVLHWDNQVIYQKSANESIIPLPDLSAYSNLYLNLNPLPVLNMQLGADVRYFTEYYSPTYEAATQQFRLQQEIKVGNYPLTSAYLNCRLHQVRFFINFYNISTQFINKGAYFSLPHYPLNPMTMKLGLSIDFNN